MTSANYARHFDRSEAEGEISLCLYEFDLRKLRGLFQRALDEGQATLGLLAQQFFAIVALALHAVKFIRNRQRRQHRNFLRVHGFRRVRDRLYFFVDVLRESLHVLRIQLSLDGVHLPENLNFYRPAHGVSARPYRHNTTFAPGINPARPRAPLVRSPIYISRAVRYRVKSSLLVSPARAMRIHLLAQGAPHGHQASFQEIRRCAATPYPDRATPSAGGATDCRGSSAPAHVPRWAAAHCRRSLHRFLGYGMETSRAKRDCHEHEFVFRLHSYERADEPARRIQRPRKKYRPWQTHRHRDARFTRSKFLRAGHRDSTVIAAGNRRQESSGAYCQFTLFFLSSTRRAGGAGRQRFLPGVLRLSRLHQRQHFLCGHALPRMFRVHRRP